MCSSPEAWVAAVGVWLMGGDSFFQEIGAASSQRLRVLSWIEKVRSAPREEFLTNP